MKRIKRKLRREIDNIEIRSKSEILQAAGIETDLPPKRNFAFRRIPIVIAAAVIMSLCAMFTLAEDGEILTKVQNIFAPEKQKETEEPKKERKPAVVEYRNYWSEEFNISLDYRVDSSDRSKDDIFYYRSVKDAVAHMGEFLYYPDCEEQLELNYATIICSARGSGNDAYLSFQIGYYNEKLTMVWIYEGTGHFGYGHESEIYISNGNTFYIDEFNDGHKDCYLSWGIIDGNTYQLQTDTAETAKTVIDSFTEAE